MVSGRLRIAQVIMFAQAVASLGIWVVQLLTISVRLDHNQDVAGSVWFVMVLNPLIAVLVALAAAFLTRRPWARGLALCMEAVGAVSALISVLTGFYQAVIAILLAIGVVMLVTSGSRRSALAA
jgi:glucan phosphoethanolaminetransferase (alkaline phosphatase superfamily)